MLATNLVYIRYSARNSWAWSCGQGLSRSAKNNSALPAPAEIQNAQGSPVLFSYPNGNQRHPLRLLKLDKEPKCAKMRQTGTWLKGGNPILAASDIERHTSKQALLLLLHPSCGPLSCRSIPRCPSSSSTGVSTAPESTSEFAFISTSCRLL